MEDIAEKFKNKVMVSLDENDWKSMEEECKDGFVLKLANGLPFNLTGLSNVLTKMWNMERRVNFTELGNNMALARFRHRSDMQKIRDGGPWLCLGTFIVMHDWCPDLSPEEFVMKRLGVWAQFHNLPVGAVLKGKEVGEKLAPNIGSLVKVSQAESETSKKRYIRVRVEIAIDKVPVTGFFLERPSWDPLWVSVIYERLPGGCLRCGKLDHVTEDCSLQTEQGLARGQGDGGSKAAKSVSKGSRTEAEVARGVGVEGRKRCQMICSGGGIDGKANGRWWRYLTMSGEGSLPKPYLMTLDCNGRRGLRGRRGALLQVRTSRRKLLQQTAWRWFLQNRT
ncbi:unnamed protein product [Rhodiola kirilowii]